MECEDEETRLSYIDEACGGDAQVRREVESLLKETGELGDFLESPAFCDPCKTNSEIRSSKFAAHAEVTEQEGGWIGNYKLLQKIGEGGCGVVYLAEQEHPVRRRVALKIIKLGMDTRTVIARFESERQALALMDHENIARVFDAGATDSGRPYFVMELVQGVSISEFCDREKLATRDRIGLFTRAANAIQHAHQKGIIHRDIKPSNILVAHHDGVPVPKIIDFGIAKATEQRLTDKTLFTVHHAFMGTPAYMSPEQAEASGLDVDTRSDVYSLGALLYELLAGKTPIDGSDLEKVGISQCRTAIRESEHMRPSVRYSKLPKEEQEKIAKNRRAEVHGLLQLLRVDLDWIVMKCLEKERTRRYATVNALVADIERYLNGEVVLARPPSNVYRLQKLVQRHSAVFAAAACVFFLLFGGIATTTWQMLRAQSAERQATEAKSENEVLLRKAEEGWAQAISNERAADLNTYVANINLTHHALKEGNFGRALQLIQSHYPTQEEEDLRGFEWRYLAGLCQGDAHIQLPNQNGEVRSLAVTSDGNTLAVGTSDRVNLWDMPSRTLITSLSTGGRSVAFLESSGLLVTSDREAVRMWDGTTFLIKGELGNQCGPVSLSKDQSYLSTVSENGVHVWKTEGWHELTLLSDAKPPVAFSPDGKSVATNSRDGILIWDITTSSVLRRLDDSEDLLNFFHAFPADRWSFLQTEPKLWHPCI